MKKIVSQVKSAIDRYNMIQQGDSIAVCLSGGKDSTVLLIALAEIQKYYSTPFSLKAITVDPGFYNVQTDYSKLEDLCAKLNVEYTIKRTDLFEIVFKIRQEKNPCSLCARMRRGILHDTAKQVGCNKIALGHHFDDATETFLLNLFNNGQISCFSPVTYLSRKNIHMIRPLIYCKESKINSVVSALNIPVIKSACPADGHTQRQAVKELIESLKKLYPDIPEKIFGAIERAKINGW